MIAASSGGRTVPPELALAQGEATMDLDLVNEAGVVVSACRSPSLFLLIVGVAEDASLIRGKDSDPTDDR